MRCIPARRCRSACGPLAAEEDVAAKDLPPPVEPEVTEEMESSAGFGPNECDYITYDPNLKLVHCIS